MITVGSTVVARKLGRDAKSVRELGFAAAILP